MQKITPFLWFDDQAEEAVAFYTSLFKGSKTGEKTRYNKDSANVSGRPEGSVMTIAFELLGQKFTALNGGPEFKFSPAVSFFVRCNSKEEVDKLWQALSQGGSALMELGQYPFSEKYGWLQDKYGVSWQLLFTDLPEKIMPCLLFVGDQFGKAEEAGKFYRSAFKNSMILKLERYAEGEGDKPGAVKYSAFELDGQEFVAMESSLDHKFGFTMATSFVVNCETQEEIDCFWEALCDGGEESQCGWLTDKYGVAWQVVPTVLPELLAQPNKLKAEGVMKAMLKMKKLDIAELKRAAETVRIS